MPARSYFSCKCHTDKKYRKIMSFFGLPWMHLLTQILSNKLIRDNRCIRGNKKHLLVSGTLHSVSSSSTSVG